MASSNHYRIHVEADATRALESLQELRRDLVRLDYDAPDLSDRAADYIIAKEDERAEHFFQTREYGSVARKIGVELMKFEDVRLKAKYGRTWKEITLREALRII